MLGIVHYRIFLDGIFSGERSSEIKFLPVFCRVLAAGSFSGRRISEKKEPSFLDGSAPLTARDSGARTIKKNERIFLNIFSSVDRASAAWLLSLDYFLEHRIGMGQQGLRIFDVVDGLGVGDEIIIVFRLA
jgi:hypothetical protein